MKLTRWLVDNLVWDTSGIPRQGFRRVLWASRKLLFAIVGAALLTWWEWVEHHPPEIVLIALIHLVFVLVAVAIVIRIRQAINHRRKRVV